MIKEIYRVRIQKLVKDYAYFQSFANEANRLVDGLNADIEAHNAEIENVIHDESLTPHEQHVLIGETLHKVEEIANKLTQVMAEVESKYQALNKDRVLLSEVIMEDSPELTDDIIQQEIDKQMKKLL
jgi:protein involved in ribonucleotide reduction